MRIRNRFVLMLALGVMAAGYTMAAREVAAERSFDRTLKVTGPVDLDIASSSGRIRVTAGEPGRVRIRGAIHGHDEASLPRLEWNPPIEQEGNTIRVGRPIGRIEDREWLRNVSISYDVVVPPETRLHARTGVGEQWVEGIHGPVDAASSSGKLTLSSIEGEVLARTGVGDIEISSVRGRVHAATSSGSIHGAAISGPIAARTGVGRVTLEGNAAPELEVATSSGNVEIRGARGAVRVRTGVGHIVADGVIARTWNLSTSSGNVTVHVPPQSGFDLRARTSSGRIQTDRAIAVQGVAGSQELRGKVRGGGSLLDVRTGVGSIRIG